MYHPWYRLCLVTGGTGGCTNSLFVQQSHLTTGGACIFLYFYLFIGHKILVETCEKPQSEKYLTFCEL